MKRIVLFGTLALATSLPALAQQPVTLRYWTRWVAQEPSLRKELDLFMRQNPGIRVELTNYVGDQYTRVFDLAFKSRNSPDLFNVDFDGIPGGLRQMAQQRWVMPLDRWATPAWQKTFPAGSFVEGRTNVDGKIYTAPWGSTGSNYINLYINNKVFRDAGLVDAGGRVRIPRTWAEQRRFAKQITDRSGGRAHGIGFGAKQGFYAITTNIRSVPLSSARPIFFNDGFINWQTGRAEFATNPIWQDWFNWWIDVKNDGSIFPQSLTVDDEQARVLFAEGRYGMYVSGFWSPNSWKTTNPNFTDYTIAPLPTQTSPARGFLPADGQGAVAISTQTKHPEEAWKLLSFLNSRASGLRWASYGEGARVWPESAESMTGKAADIARLQVQNVRAVPPFRNVRPQIDDVKGRPIAQDIAFYILAAYTGQLRKEGVPAALRKLEADYNKAIDDGIAEAQRAGSKVKRADFAFPNWNPRVSSTSLR